MAEAVQLSEAGGLAYREAGAGRGGVPVLCLHGFPETSYMWHHLLGELAASGRRALAPDLTGFGDSEPDRPGTWERQMDAVERFRRALGLEQVVLVVHDWGGLIGLRWACEQPGAVAGLVISNSGFFPEGRWHGFAEVLRTEGEGERTIDAMSRDGLGGLLGTLSRGFSEQAIDEYWKSFATEERRRSLLDLYRSGDFEKLAPYQGQLGALGVPTLLLWGEDDPFAPLAGAHRFLREVPHAQLVVVEGAGHFVYADEPERCAREIVSFLERGETA